MTNSNKILWLASYPKSGNTWFRIFLSALCNNGVVNINQLRFNEIFSSRQIFDHIADIDSSYLYEHEVKNLIPGIYREIGAQTKEELRIIKAHDALIHNSNGNSIFPKEVSYGAIYFVRNPLDIVSSLAHHNNFSLADSVNFLNNPEAYFTPQKGNLNVAHQLRQYLGTWSFHVGSWVDNTSIKTHVIRYEDMLTDTFNTFSKALKFMGWTQYTNEDITKALTASSFEKLSKQEKIYSFKERAGIERDQSFFRKGTYNNWKTELDSQLAKLIFKHHKNMMLRFNYC